MKVILIQEAVYFEYLNEQYSPRIDYETYWNRFLNVFEEVIVIARVKKIERLESNLLKSSGPRVKFIGLPYYRGALGFLRLYTEINKKIQLNIKTNNTRGFVLRIPGLLGELAYKHLTKSKHEYAVEVVGDPFEVANFLPIPSFLRMPYSYYSRNKMRNIVRRASAALYVTNNILQSRYPPSEIAITTSASNVIINKENILENTKDRIKKCLDIPIRANSHTLPPIKIGVIGMLYEVKSPLEIVEAANHLIKKGFNISVEFVGEGPLREKIDKISRNLGIKDRIKCLGSLPAGEAIFNFLDNIDIFLQFSKTEGLPRSLLEALARGCPAVASKVGGNSEVLLEEQLVPANDIVKLVDKLSTIINSSEKLEKYVQHAVNTVINYRSDILNERRITFYKKYLELIREDGN